MVHQQDNWRIHRDAEWIHQIDSYANTNGCVWVKQHSLNLFLVSSVTDYFYFFFNSSTWLKKKSQFFSPLPNRHFSQRRFAYSWHHQCFSILQHAKIHKSVCSKSKLCKISPVFFGASCWRHFPMINTSFLRIPPDSGWTLIHTPCCVPTELFQTSTHTQIALPDALDAPWESQKFTPLAEQVLGDSVFQALSGPGVLPAKHLSLFLYGLYCTAVPQADSAL